MEELNNQINDLKEWVKDYEENNRAFARLDDLIKRMDTLTEKESEELEHLEQTLT